MLYEAAFVDFDTHSVIGVFDSLPKAIRHSLLLAIRPSSLEGGYDISIRELEINKYSKKRGKAVFFCPRLFRFSDEWYRLGIEEENYRWYYHKKLRVLALLPLMKYLKRSYKEV